MDYTERIIKIVEDVIKHRKKRARLIAELSVITEDRILDITQHNNQKMLTLLGALCLQNRKKGKVIIKAESLEKLPKTFRINSKILKNGDVKYELVHSMEKSKKKKKSPAKS